jgi:hypothetical protein
LYALTGDLRLLKKFGRNLVSKNLNHQIKNIEIRRVKSRTSIQEIYQYEKQNSSRAYFLPEPSTFSPLPEKEMMGNRKAKNKRKESHFALLKGIDLALSRYTE